MSRVVSTKAIMAALLLLTGCAIRPPALAISEQMCAGHGGLRRLYVDEHVFSGPDIELTCNDWFNYRGPL